MNFYLGVDAGGTTSKSRLTDEEGNILGVGHAGSANTRVGIATLHATLLDVCKQATMAAGLEEGQLGSIRCGMGIAGINRMGMKSQIQALSFPFANLQLSSDSMAASVLSNVVRTALALGATDSPYRMKAVAQHLGLALSGMPFVRLMAEQSHHHSVKPLRSNSPMLSLRLLLGWMTQHLGIMRVLRL
jgi:N-acetylglucosamine kinase-like BadF-type ATPase